MENDIEKRLVDLNITLPNAAAPAANDGGPSCVLQRARGVHDQHLYWICMTHPKQGEVVELGMEVPSDLGRAGLSKVMADAHGEEGIEVLETVSFLPL